MGSRRTDSSPLSSQIGYGGRRDALRLFAWHEVDNFGDRLGPALFHRISGRPVAIEARKFRPTFEGPRREIHCFLGTLAQLLEGPHHFVLWGFGAAPGQGPGHHGCRPMRQGLDLEIRALRGLLTRDVLVNAGYAVGNDVPYGDPALLAPAFFDRSPRQVNDFCLVPHHSDYDEWRWRFPGFNVIDIRTPSYDVLGALILELTKYRAVFTSSLHVTILAEAFGIPVQPMAPKLPFKFDDFYSAVGKRAQYLTLGSADPEWGALYEQAIGQWRPVCWDPLPWLAAAPFPVDSQVGKRLARHYRTLGGGKAGIWPFLRRLRRPAAESGFPREAADYYGRLRRAQPNDAEPEAWEEVNTFGAGDWIPCGSGRLPVVEPNGDGIVLRGHESLRYASTTFLRTSGTRELRFRVPVTHAGGNAQILVQDDAYVTKASVFVREGEEPGLRELRVVSIPPEESLRLCVIIFSGSVTVGRVTLSADRDAGSESEQFVPLAACASGE